MEGLRAAQHLIADKGHGSDKLVEQAKKQGIQVQIPARKSRKTIDNAIWWKTPVRTSSNGGGAQRATPGGFLCCRYQFSMLLSMV